MSDNVESVIFGPQPCAEALLHEFVTIKARLTGPERTIALANWSASVDRWYEQQAKATTVMQ